MVCTTGWLGRGALVALLGIVAAACGPDPRTEIPVRSLFTRLPASYTGIAFENRLTDTEAFNVFTYRNYYNGGGVGIGDVNGDGLPDLYLTANQQPNRLYLNRGGFRFEDVTDRAGVAGTRAWSTGVSLADVNGDGWVDIYVCNAGNHEGDDKANELFINLGPDDEGIPRFEEQAAAYGLADEGYGTHAAFFDYDRDGDLDLYLLNNSFRPVSSFGLRNIRHERHPYGGDKLFRNDGGRFVDVSEAAGIYGSEIGFGLGVTVGDVDRDGWPDIYVSNDFFERDYLYLNQGDGTFREVLEERMPSISLSSMGADMADVTGDGFPEIYVTDMLPEDDVRLKTTSSFESWNVYQAKLRNDYHHQFMRNTLQRNNGDGTFSEIGQIAGVAATDWSWGALMADLDNDGHLDIFVSNGIFKDLTDQDFIAYFADEVNRAAARGRRDLPFLDLLARIPSNPIPNYAFHNAGDGTFVNRAAEWGLAEPSFSNGAAYGDLDGDGDLDLVVNNVNMEAFVFRNETDSLRDHHYLKVRLEGEAPNPDGLGATLTVRAGEALFYREQMPMRGFQSSVDRVLHVGLGTRTRVDSVVVRWPDGRRQVWTDVPADQTLTARQAEAVFPDENRLRQTPPASPRPFADVTAQMAVDYTHRENPFVDFHREGLLPKMLSTEGPALAVGDVNGDGLDDLYVGGAKEAAGTLLLARPGGGFRPAGADVFEADAVSEDVGAALFDADGDGDLDLYVVSGGYEFSPRAPALEDRLYLNQGRGRFRKAEGALPRMASSGSCVVPADVDGDGDLDLFVGGRLQPWRYGYPASSHLLLNDGRGHFTDATDAAAPVLKELGMVTDAAWVDVNGDGALDLAVVGEWMPITVLLNDGAGRFSRPTAPDGLAGTHGLWNRLLAADFDGDGDTDFVVGNLGLNTKLKAAPDEPMTLHVADFDGNGAVEQVLSYYKQGRSYPLPLRNELLGQLNVLKKRFPTHRDYAGRTLEEVLTPEERAAAVVQSVTHLASVYVENRGDGTFRVTPLPYEAQFAPIYGLLAGDADGDGHLDLLVAGNFYGVQTNLGRMDASYGLLLRGDGQGGFDPVPARASGFRVDGQVRHLAWVRQGRARYVVVARNDAPLLFFRQRPPGESPAGTEDRT